MDRKIEVDLWKTGMHGIEVGVKQDEQHRAKSRQFSKDMDIIGEYKEGDKKGYVAYRTTPWDEEKDDLKRKIVLKSFTESMGWKGTLEEMIGRGLAQSFAAGKNLPTFMMNLSKTNRMITLEKVQRAKSMGKEIYSFFIVDEEEDTVHPFIIEADRFTIGSDWNVRDMRGDKIAKIDGSKFNVGGKYKIEIDTKKETYRIELAEVLVLFATLNKFLGDVAKKIDKAHDRLRKGKEQIVIDKDEEALYQNPRLVRK
ncbi:MAG: hypothetical protein ACW99A_08710 [Candidatus Kariarchaeaceae archaeon]|jgi:uncharacterized protein YxjI